MKLFIQSGFDINITEYLVLLPDMKVKHKLSAKYTKTGSFRASGGTFENMTPFSAVTLDNL